MSDEDPIRPEGDEGYWQAERRWEYLHPDHDLFGLDFRKPKPSALEIARQQHKDRLALIEAMKHERRRARQETR